MRFLAIPSLRWRLVVVMCLAYIFSAVTTLSVSYSAQRSNLQKQLQSSARNNAAILAAGSVGPLTTGSLPPLQTFVRSLRRSESVSYAVVAINGGRIVASTNLREIGKTLALPSLGAIPGPTSRGLSSGDELGIAPVVGTTVLGVAEVRLSDQSVQRDLQNALFLDVVARTIGLVLFLLLSLLIARYILGPLTILAGAARAIHQGLLSTRVPAHGRTELATVGEAFNEMAGGLEQRITHLSFLAEAGATLQNTFRDKGDLEPMLRDFCKVLGACEAALLMPGEDGALAIQYEVSPEDLGCRQLVRRLGESVHGQVVALQENHAVMAVPVMSDVVFVTAREDGRQFSQEEQQVITNFAYQIGMAADNARLFEAQQEALQAKDQFLSIVSHELRTPLTTVKGYAQMLEHKLAKDPDGKRYAENIDAQSSRLGRLVDDLLDVTRFTRGQFELMPEPMDLKPLLEEVVARFRMVAPEHTLALNVDGQPLEGYWDHDRLEQVMSNLVSNAIKYSQPGSEVTVEADREDGNLAVTVRDQGMGISKADQEKLFQRFYRGSAEGQEIKGLGLGLYVTRRIVEAHGGTIWVHSKPGEGSAFTFTLPVAVEAAPEAVGISPS